MLQNTKYIYHSALSIPDKYKNKRLPAEGSAI